MAADGQPAGNPRSCSLSSLAVSVISRSPSKGGLLADQTPHHFGREALHSLPGSRRSGGSSTGAAAEPGHRGGSNQIPELHKRPWDKDSAAEGTQPPPLSKTTFQAQRSPCVSLYGD